MIYLIITMGNFYFVRIINAIQYKNSTFKTKPLPESEERMKFRSVQHPLGPLCIHAQSIGKKSKQLRIIGYIVDIIVLLLLNFDTPIRSFKIQV